MKGSVTAVILAGGSGTRFWPVNQDKCFVEFMGEPFVKWSVLDALPDRVEKIVVIANEKNRGSFQSLTYPCPHVIVQQMRPMGMADALMSAKEELGNAPLLVLIADHFVEKPLLEAVVEKGANGPVHGVLPGWKPGRYFPGGYLDIASDGETIRGIVEKPGEGNEPSQHVVVSGHYFADSQLLLSYLDKAKTQKDDRYEVALDLMMKDLRFVMVPYEGVSVSLKYPWDILDAMDAILKTHCIKSHIPKDARIADSVSMEGPVVLGKNVRIFEHTKIVGPVYIGDNAIIGNNSMVRESMIGASSVVGFNSDIARSYIGMSNWFHSNYLGDSVTGANVSMGSGTVLANLRLDEGTIGSVVGNERHDTKRPKLGAVIGNDVRIGVNASIMPGIKIGTGSFIGAGVVLTKDVPDNTFVAVKQDQEVRGNDRSVAKSDRGDFLKKIT